MPSRFKPWSTPRLTPSGTSSGSWPTSSGWSVPQLKFADRQPWPGSWTYSDQKFQGGDNSNTQYALLGLNAASEAGVSIDARGLGLVARVLREIAESRRRLVLSRGSRTIDGQHDLRGAFELDHHRRKAVSEPGVSRRPHHPQLRQGRAGPGHLARHRLAEPATFTSIRTSATAGCGSITTSTPSSAGRLAGIRFFGAIRLVSAGSRGTGPHTKPGGGILAWIRPRKRADRNQLCASSFWPRAVRLF